MSKDYKFEGWMGHDKDSVNGKLVWEEFEPKPWEETDVDIQITHCGICATDLHTLRSGHGQTPYPICVGHEIIGKVVRAGSQVKNLKTGDRVGVGAMNSSCLKPDCEECSSGIGQYCAQCVTTYGGTYPNGGKSHGGYAKYHRSPAAYAFKIPEGLPSEEAAPIMCGGITMFSPLKNEGCGPGKKVGIVGVGGLGHYGILFAKAMGADKVVGISRKNDKRADVLRMGADEYIATSEEKGWAKKNSRTLDLIICTVNSHSLPLSDYMRLLRTRGTFIQVGAPEDKLPALSAGALIGKAVKIGGSMIGSPSEIEEMMKLAVDKNIKAWVQTRPMREANQAVLDMEAGKARFRYCLVNENESKL